MARMQTTVLNPHVQRKLAFLYIVSLMYRVINMVKLNLHKFIYI